MRTMSENTGLSSWSSRKDDLRYRLVPFAAWAKWLSRLAATGDSNSTGTCRVLRLRALSRRSLMRRASCDATITAS